VGGGTGVGAVTVLNEDRVVFRSGFFDSVFSSSRAPVHKNTAVTLMF